jgi:hypothetical protein
MNANFLKLRFFFTLPVTPIIFAGFLTAGSTLILALLGSSAFTESVREVSQVVPAEGAITHGTRGIRLPLPAPNEEVNELVKDGWILDLPNNNEQPVQCRHKIVVNGSTLTDCSDHQQIADSLPGAFSVWEAGQVATVHMSLPESAKRIESMVVQWHLVKKSAAVLSPRQEMRRLKLGIIGIVLCFVGSFGLAMLQSILRKNWANSIITISGGTALGLILGCGLIGTMSTNVGQWLSAFLSMSVLFICLGILSLGVALSISVRWVRPFNGIKVPSLAIIALSVGVSVTSLVSGWVSTKLPTSPYDGSGPMSALLAGRIPFSDAGGWYAGMSSLNNGHQVSWAARRPVNALIRSGEYELAGGNYQWSLLVQAIIFSLAISALTISVWSAISPAVALIIWVGAFRVGQGFLCSYLTESVGYSCACLSLAYLLTGCRDHRFGVRLAGIAWLGMAWLTRPGPLGLLAVPILLEAVTPVVGRFRRTAIAVAVMAGVLLGGKVIFQLVATDNAVENANTAPVLYGLAIGKRYDLAEIDFDAVSPERVKMSLPERTSLMYSEAWQKFVANPTPVINKSLRVLHDGFNNAVITLPERLWTNLLAIVVPWKIPGNTIGWILFVGATLSASVMIKRKILVGLLLFGSVIGLIASLPIIWGDGSGLRAVIISTPSLMVFLALLFAVPEGLYSCYTSTQYQQSRLRISNTASAAVLTMLGIGVAVYALRKSPSITLATPMSISMSNDPAVFITDNHSSSHLSGPAMLTKNDAVRSLRERSMDNYKLDEFISNLKTDSLIALKTHKSSYQMVVIEDVGTPRNGILIVEATEPTSIYFFIRATKWHWLEE